MMQHGNMAIWQYDNMTKWGEEAYNPAIQVWLRHSKEVSEIALLAKQDVSVRVIPSGGHATLEPNQKGTCITHYGAIITYFVPVMITVTVIVKATRTVTGFRHCDYRSVDIIQVASMYFPLVVCRG